MQWISAFGSVRGGLLKFGIAQDLTIREFVQFLQYAFGENLQVFDVESLLRASSVSVSQTVSQVPS